MRWGSVLASGALIWSTAGAAAAAPEVLVAAKAPSHRDATAAARELGVSQWGRQSGTATELVLQLDRSRGVLTASLPTTAPEAAAKRWLQDTADHLGWASPSLSMHRSAGALLLKLEGGRAVSNPGLTSSRVNLTLAPLAARLGQLSSTPVLLCVRLPGAAVISRSPAPIHEGKVDGDHFLFYQPSGLAAGPLAIEFGIPPRWPVAAMVAALLWLAAPFGMALGVRAYLAQHPSLPPMRRVSMFDRWMLVGGVAAMLGLFITIRTLDLDRLRYLGLTSLFDGSLALAPFWFWCQGAAGMARRRLVRDAAPDAPTGNIDAAVSLASAVLFVLAVIIAGVMGGSLGTVAPFRPSAAGGAAVGGWLLTAGGVLLLLVFTPIYVLSFRMTQPAAALTPVDDPETLKVTLGELTEQAVRERQEYTANPELLDKFAAVAQMNAVVRAIVALDPDQQAAIGVAGQHAAFESSLRMRWQTGAACGIAVLIILSGIWQRLHPLGNGSLRALLLCGLFFTLGALIFRYYLGRSRQRQGEVDLQVALAMDEPRRYLEALRQLAEHEQFNAVMTNSASMALGFRERARQLECRLHLD